MRLLVIDDDAASTRLVQAAFAQDGFDVEVVHSGKSGIASARARVPDVVLLDLHLPDIDGMEVLERFRSARSTLPIVILTSEHDFRSALLATHVGGFDSAARATQLGAFDYLTKPFDDDELRLVVGRALETGRLKAEVKELRKRLFEGGDLAQQMGPSPEVTRIVDQVGTVAASIFSVLILGESGTGKELVAQALHRQSDRHSRPFIALDCGAIPESLLESELFGHEKGAFTGAEKKKGRFHLAESGTIFLDEIGNLPMSLQSKLLRVLESREVQPLGALSSQPIDARFVAATNDDLHARAKAGHFRADLFFRLAQYTITLPPLRNRTSDIPSLAQRFMEEASLELRRPVQEISPDALARLQRHAWPGNVRELRNVIRRAVLESKDVVLKKSVLLPLLDDKPTDAPPERSHRSLREVADEAARAAEREAIDAVMRTTRGNKTQAARLLVTDVKTLHVKMKLLGIRASDFKP